MRKSPTIKRVTRGLPLAGDPPRLAVAALERIKTVLERTGHGDRFGGPISDAELAARSSVLGMGLPPSYAAVMRIAQSIGRPEIFLSAEQQRHESKQLAGLAGEEGDRYVPFCRSDDQLVCFDKGGQTATHPEELPIVGWHDGSPSPLAQHFGAWLDAVADAREERSEAASVLPERLSRLLHDLGFRFTYPLVATLETVDERAIAALLSAGGQQGGDRARGTATLTLHVDDFTLTAALADGTRVFEADVVFRWLRTFRDANFFSDVASTPSRADTARDLRAPRGRGARPSMPDVVALSARPVGNLVLQGASGRSAEDFRILGRLDDRPASVIFNVVSGRIVTSDTGEPFDGLHITSDGTMWGLGAEHATRFVGQRKQRFSLFRPGPRASGWNGIGGDARVLVWGVGALLEFDGHEFVPFAPNADLDPTESVVALSASNLKIWMLVCSDRMGAVARFDAVAWQPIGEDQVIVGALVGLDVFGGIAHVLDREGGLWNVAEGPPRAVDIDHGQRAFRSDDGARRPLVGLCAHESGFLLASRGGVIVTEGTNATFHATPDRNEAVRLVRLGRPQRGPTSTAILVLSGPYAWIWRDGRFAAIEAPG